MARLNERQTKFCENYAKSGNAVQSYIDAGYDIKSEAGARASSSKLLTNANIAEYIKELTDKTRSESIADLIEIKEFWTKVVRSDEEEMTHRIKCTELMAKTQGAFIDRQEISHSGNLSVYAPKKRDDN